MRKLLLLKPACPAYRQAGGRQGGIEEDYFFMRIIFTPAAEGHGLCPWMNAPAFGRDVALLGREVGYHGLCPWGSTSKGI